MTDSKKDTNKLRKPFFWRRKRQAPEDAEAMSRPSLETEHPKKRPWYRPTLAKAIGALVIVAAISSRAHGQFGIDTAAILAALSKMQSLMNTYIAAPLKTINQYEQSDRQVRAAGHVSA